MIAELLLIGSSFAAAASKFTAVVGAGKGAYDIYKNFTQLNHIGEIRKSLKSMGKDLQQPNHKSSEEGFLDFWLTRAELLSPLFKQRLAARFALTLLVIIVAQVGGDTAKALTKHEEIVNILQMLIQISSCFIVNPNSFLEKEEKQFFINLTALQTMFYKASVLPAIGIFNKSLEQVTTEPIFDKEKWGQSWGQISRKFLEAKKEDELFMENLKKINSEL